MSAIAPKCGATGYVKVSGGLVHGERGDSLYFKFYLKGLKLLRRKKLMTKMLLV